MDLPKLRELRQSFAPFDNPVDSHSYSMHVEGIIKKAAVLVLLRWNQQKEIWEVLLTTRSEQVSTHKGEVAFPGGIRDSTDSSPVHTALREAYEEIGLPESYVDIVGTVKPFRTGYNILLYPVITMLRPNVLYEPFPNEEVAQCFWLPFQRFLSSTGHTMQTFSIGDRTIATNVFEDTVAGVEGSVTVWGITSFIAVVLSMIVHRHKATFDFPAFWTLPTGKPLPSHINWSQIPHAILDSSFSISLRRGASKL